MRVGVKVIRKSSNKWTIRGDSGGRTTIARVSRGEYVARTTMETIMIRYK